MQLKKVRIVNFRSCREINLEIGNMHALVGANNSGKSAILRALDFLFNPSVRNLNEESFWSKDTTLEIRVEAVFSDLTDEEKETLKGYTKPDGTFHIARSARRGTKSDEDASESDQDADRITIGQHYMKPIPAVEWLQESEINGAKIKEWWKNREQLTVGGVSFSETLGAKMPMVGDWKDRAAEFASHNAAVIPMKEDWIDNPKGYANVLKAMLPLFVLVPAVRDVTDEAKGTKSSPFGRLLYAILDTVTQERKQRIDEILGEVAKQLNRVGGEERVPLIADTERQLNRLLSDLFVGCDLEIEFETPSLEDLLSEPRLYVDDGFRTAVENKGHGLQRAVIFTILRRYAEYMTAVPSGRKRNLILAVEEPELFMHPQAQRTIRRVFRKIAEGGDQVLFSTHSSLQVDVAYFDEIIRMESRCEIVDGKKTICSAAYQLPMAKMIEDILSRIPSLNGKVTAQSMRDRYSHAYNPRRSEGFFASKVILVEGTTEEYSLPIYADALPNCAFDPQGISVVECGGKGTIDRLFRVFNELHVPCYILFDYDKTSADKNTTEKSRELLALVGQPTAAPETLFVSDRIACFPNKWEVDLKSEIPDADSLTCEAKKELGVNDEGGKPLIARYIARKITERNPPVIPRSLKLIIEKAVALTWKHSCLETSKAPSGSNSTNRKGPTCG